MKLNVLYPSDFNIVYLSLYFLKKRLSITDYNFYVKPLSVFGDTVGSLLERKESRQVECCTSNYRFSIAMKTLVLDNIFKVSVSLPSHSLQADCLWR